MLALRRLAGVLLLLMGAAGVIGSVAAIYKTRAIQKQLLSFAMRSFDVMEDGAANIRHKANQIALSARDLRSELKTAFLKLNGLNPDVAVREKVSDNAFSKTDSEVQERLRKARRFVDSALTAAGILASSLELMNTWGLLEGNSQGGSLSDEIEKISAVLARLPATISEALETARDLKRGPGSGPILTRLKGQIKGIDERLAEVQTFFSGVMGAIQESGKRLSEYKKKSIWWIQLGGVAVPILLVWLGAGQAALIIVGGRLCIRKRGKTWNSDIRIKKNWKFFKKAANFDFS